MSQDSRRTRLTRYTHFFLRLICTSPRMNLLRRQGPRKIEPEDFEADFDVEALAIVIEEDKQGL